MNQGKLYIIAAPSGAGKSSLLKTLVQQTRDVFVSISYTTRLPRPGEREGVDYYFVSQEKFAAMVKQNKFLEHAIAFFKIANHRYGTPRYEVEQQLKLGKKVVLEIDWQGAEQVFAKLPQTLGIFILPPSLHVLKTRLTTRAQDDADTIGKRMSVAQDEISHYRDYHYLVVNEDFEQALAELKAIFQGQQPPIDWKNTPLPPQLHQLLNDLST